MSEYNGAQVGWLSPSCTVRQKKGDRSPLVCLKEERVSFVVLVSLPSVVLE